MSIVTTLGNKTFDMHLGPLALMEWCPKPSAVNIFGTMAIWGAGAKGATFCNLVDPDCKYIQFVVDITPEKQGKYVPGTGHLIVSYEALKISRTDTVILMNPNYHEENQKLLDAAGIKAMLIDAN